MESVISNLLNRYERGLLTRRELIKVMGALAAVSTTASAAQVQNTVAAPGFQGSAIEHVSIFVSDRERSKAFYQNVFGLSVVSDAADAARLGPGKIMVVLRPSTANAGRVDHLAIGVSDATKDSVIQNLKQRGATVLEGGEANLHVKDPDGLIIELIANDRSWR